MTYGSQLNDKPACPQCSEPRQRTYFYFFILPLAVLLRLYELGGKQLWLDELLQVRLTASLDLKEVLLDRMEHTAAAPLDFLAQHFFLTLLGQTEFAARLHAALFGTLAILALYRLTQILFDQRTSLMTALLYACYPLHHHYSQEGRPYALCVLLTICTYLAFVHLLQSGKAKHYFYYTAVTVALVYTHHFGVFITLSQTVFVSLLFFYRRPGAFGLGWKVDRRALIKYLLSVLLSISLYIPWALAGLDDAVPASANLNWGLFWLVIKELGDRSYPLALVLFALGVCGCLKLRREHRNAQLLLLLLWFLLPILLIFIVLWLRDHFFAIRYVLFTTPALLILVAQGIIYLSEAVARHKPSYQDKVRVIMTSLLLAISLVVIFIHLPDRYDDLKSAGQFLRKNVEQEDIVVAPKIADVLRHYFPDLPEHSRDINALSQPESLTGHRIYLVQSKYLSDEEKKLFAEFRAQTHGANVINFRGIQIIESVR